MGALEWVRAARKDAICSRQRADVSAIVRLRRKSWPARTKRTAPVKSVSVPGSGTAEISTEEFVTENAVVILFGGFSASAINKSLRFRLEIP